MVLDPLLASSSVPNRGRIPLGRLCELRFPAGRPAPGLLDNHGFTTLRARFGDWPVDVGIDIFDGALATR